MPAWLRGQAFSLCWRPGGEQSQTLFLTEAGLWESHTVLGRSCEGLGSMWRDLAQSTSPPTLAWPVV